MDRETEHTRTSGEDERTAVPGGPAVELDTGARAGDPPLEKVYVFWLAGMSCDGCTISVSGASDPSLEDLLLGRVPGLPRLLLYHPVLSVEAGDEFMENFELAAQGKLDAPYVIVLEGSAVDDSLIEGEGYWVGLGARDRDADGRPAISVMEWIDRMAPGCAAAIAIGTCATWGGIPAAEGNPTGAMSLMDYLGKEWRSAFGLPVINVPGCAPVGDNFTEVVAALLQFLQGTGPLPEFDELGRPAWQFHHTVHDRCVRGGYYEEGIFATEYGTPECLVGIGCWGPVVQCNIVERGAIRHHGGCMNQGGICIGCTMPGFPDKFSPFYQRAPGSLVSAVGAGIYGGLIRLLRRSTMSQQNRETRWDDVGDVPSGWALEEKRENPLLRLEDALYRRLQFHGAKRPGRREPETAYRDGWEVGPVLRQRARGTKDEPEETRWGQARRRAWLERGRRPERLPERRTERRGRREP